MIDYIKKFIAKENILWISLVLFFFVLSFIWVPSMQERSTFVNHLIFFAYLMGTTIIAKYIYVNHYKKIKVKLNWITLLVFIIMVFLYMVGVEVSANTYRLFEPGFLYSHLKFHVFDDTLVIIVISLIMWSVFQKFRIGRETFMMSFILGMIHSFFAPHEGCLSVLLALLGGFLWIWLFHFSWLYTSLLIRKDS